ncbi:MAG: Na+-transporting NADH:ubiquinone oxidoreductase subunit C [Alteromonadaceae bacterium]
MSNKESFGKTIAVVVAVCLVCSIVVSGAAVGLRTEQQANKLLDKQTNILEAAGLLEKSGSDIVATYEKYVSTKVLDLDTNEYTDKFHGATEPDVYDQYKAARKDGIRPVNDIAKLIRRPNKVSIYFVKNDAGKVERIILPINGSGLWNMMYAFLAIEMDGSTVKSLVYYDHKETPGLGGEVQNEQWKALWKDKQLFDAAGKLAIKVVKGGAKKGDVHGVDALSGATLTSNGVQLMLNYWLGKDGFGPYLAKMKKGGF